MACAAFRPQFCSIFPFDYCSTSIELNELEDPISLLVAITSSLQHLVAMKKKKKDMKHFSHATFGTFRAGNSANVAFLLHSERSSRTSAKLVSLDDVVHGVCH